MVPHGLEVRLHDLHLLVGLIVANIYWFSGTPLYPGHAALDATWGIAPLRDQANAGTVMMATHCLLSFVTIAVLFFAGARQEGLEQRLVEAGVPRDEIREATRSGQLEARSPPGLVSRSRPARGSIRHEVPRQAEIAE